MYPSRKIALYGNYFLTFDANIIHSLILMKTPDMKNEDMEVLSKFVVLTNSFNESRIKFYTFYKFLILVCLVTE